jgi:hypothetical protein
MQNRDTYNFQTIVFGYNFYLLVDGRFRVDIVNSILQACLCQVRKSKVYLIHEERHNVQVNRVGIKNKR